MTGQKGYRLLNKQTWTLPRLNRGVRSETVTHKRETEIELHCKVPKEHIPENQRSKTGEEVWPHGMSSPPSPQTISKTATDICTQISYLGDRERMSASSGR